MVMILHRHEQWASQQLQISVETMMFIHQHPENVP